MDTPTNAAACALPRHLASGEALCEAGLRGPVWQLCSGALRLDRMDREGPRFMQIVLPGDLLGLEQLAGGAQAFSARAIVPSQVRHRVFADDTERRAALVAGLVQQQARTADLVALRSGTAQDRLRQLLLLLAAGEPRWDGEACHRVLPTIKDVAAIIDTAPETVSRIFANLRRSQLLDGRQRQGASFSAARLREQAWPPGMTRSDGAQRQPAVAGGL